MYNWKKSTFFCFLELFISKHIGQIGLFNIRCLPHVKVYAKGLLLACEQGWDFCVLPGWRVGCGCWFALCASCLWWARPFGTSCLEGWRAYCDLALCFSRWVVPSSHSKMGTLQYSGWWGMIIIISYYHMMILLTAGSYIVILVLFLWILQECYIKYFSSLGSWF